MLKRYNRCLLYLAFANLVIAILATCATYFVVAWSVARLGEGLQLVASVTDISYINREFPTFYGTIPGMLIIFGTGFMRWRQGRRHFEHFDMAIRPEPGSIWNRENQMIFDFESTRHEIHLITQLLLVAPLRICEAIEYYRSQVAPDPDLELRLRELRDKVAANGGWHSVDAYPERGFEMVILSRVNEVELNWRDGRVRIPDSGKKGK